MLSNNIEKHRKRRPFFKFCYFFTVPLRANLASLQGRRQSLNSFLPQRRVRVKDPIRYDTIWFVLFTFFFTKQALCQHRISTLTQSDMGRQGGAWRNIGKNAYMKGCCKCWKTTKAKDSIVCAQKRHQPRHEHKRPHKTIKANDSDASLTWRFGASHGPRLAKIWPHRLPQAQGI